MIIETHFVGSVKLNDILEEILKSQVDMLLEQAYDNIQANTVTSQIESSTGGNTK